MVGCMAVSSVRPRGLCLARAPPIGSRFRVSGFACQWQSPANPLPPLCQCYRQRGAVASPVRARFTRPRIWPDRARLKPDRYVRPSRGRGAGQEAELAEDVGQAWWKLSRWAALARGRGSRASRAAGRRGQMRPARVTQAAAAAREERPSLRKMLARCRCTVCSLKTSR